MCVKKHKLWIRSRRAFKRAVQHGTEVSLQSQADWAGVRRLSRKLRRKS